jgi:hypothetical protein
MSTQCWVRVHFLANRNMELPSRWNHYVNIYLDFFDVLTQLVSVTRKDETADPFELLL